MEGANEHERDENLCPQDTPARLQAPHAKQGTGGCEQTPPVRPLQLHNAATVRQRYTILGDQVSSGSRAASYF